MTCVAPRLPSSVPWGLAPQVPACPSRLVASVPSPARWPLARLRFFLFWAVYQGDFRARITCMFSADVD